MGFAGESRRDRVIKTFALCVLALIAAACGGDDGQKLAVDTDAPDALAAVGDSTTSSAAPRDVLRVAAPGTILASPVLVAESQGFFADEGLEVEIVPVADEAEALSVLKTGGADLASASMYDIALSLVTRSADLVVTTEIYGAGRVLEWNEGEGTLRLHALANSEIEGPCSLVGQRVGVPRTSSSIELMAVRRAMKNNGCDPDSIALQFLPAASRLEALLNGDVAAAAFIEPWSNEATLAGASTNFELDGSLCSRCAVGVVSAQRVWAEQNGDTIERFERAVDRAMEMSETAEIEYRAELVRCCALPVDEAATIGVPSWANDGVELVDSINDLLLVMRDDGARVGTLDAADFVYSG